MEGVDKAIEHARREGITFEGCDRVSTLIHFSFADTSLQHFREKENRPWASKNHEQSRTSAALRPEERVDYDAAMS